MSVSIRRVLLVGTVASLGLARDGGAQVAGVVQSGAAPLPRVVVSLWSSAREVARDTTDAGGRFAFDSAASAGATGLALRRLGYVARTLSVRPGDVALRPQMTQVAQPLPTTVVAATTRSACTRRDDPRARALWDSVRATYATAPRGMGQGALVSVWSQATVPAAEVGQFDETPRYAMEGSRRGGWFTTPAGAQPLWETLARDGYARRRQLPRPGEELIDPQYLHWWYAPLHRELVEHFVEPAFASAHVFTIATAAGGGRAVAFCARDTRRPGVSGTIEVDSAGAVSRIAWQWITPRPREDAGAELLLVPPSRPQARRLVPVRSVYWRRLAGREGRYYQDGVVTLAWYYSDRQSATPADRVRP